MNFLLNTSRTEVSIISVRLSRTESGRSIRKAIIGSEFSLMLLDPQSVSEIHSNICPKARLLIWIQVLPEDISTIVCLPPLSSSSTIRQKNILVAKSLHRPCIHCYHFRFSNMTTVPLFILSHKSLYYLISTTTTSGKRIATNGECTAGRGSMDSQNAFPQFLWTF